MQSSTSRPARVFASSVAMVALAVSVACGSHSGGGFAGGPGGGDDAAAGDAGTGSSSSGYVAPSGDDGSLTLMTDPNMGNGTCQTGEYTGTFSCLFFYGVEAGLGDAPDSGGIGPIVGTMSFMLSQNVTSAGELSTTDTASGTFAAATGGFIAAQADLTGTLDCTRGNFTGQLVNGIYGLSLGGSPPLADPNNKFQGPLDSMYDGTTSTFVDGQWSMAIAGEGACIGTWTAMYAGPGEGGVGPTDAGGQ